VTSKLVDTCNGLETLANYMWAAPGLTPADEDLLGTLKECGVNRTGAMTLRPPCSNGAGD